jgi:hypothetical protein
MLAVAQYVHPVDEHVRHAGRVLHRLLVRGVGGDGLGVEDGDVGERAGAKGWLLSSPAS